jgi:hypothetical protein|tara:strand:+ start:57 stop:761 length:705 start_codon:yes stop_codon:yes gene_type:complete
MKIFFNGCSWTDGQELGEKPDMEKNRFSTVLGKTFDAEIVNIAKSGTSLHRLLRSTYEYCNPSLYDLAVLQFTFPARTEYYSDDSPAGSREGKFMRMGPNTVFNVKTKNRAAHGQYRDFFYGNVYSDEMGHTTEYIVFQALQDYFFRHNVPVITLTLNANTVLPFDLYLDTADVPRAEKGHPNKQGHEVIAGKIESIIRSGNQVVDAKEAHLNRIRSTYARPINPTNPTDYPLV